MIFHFSNPLKIPQVGGTFPARLFLYNFKKFYKDRSMGIFRSLAAGLTRKILRIPVWEWILLIFVFGVLGLLLAKNGGGPQFSDELWYMDAGLNGVKDIQIMNYYFHIYLQKPFLMLASRPVAGGRYYWSFLVTLTAIMIYLCARWMNKKNTAFHSIVASAMFFSLAVLPQWAGDTKVDFTSMFVVTIIVTIYVLFTQGMLKRKAALILIGFWLFMCIKSKETTIFISALLVGFGFTGEDKCNWKEFFKSLLFVLIGFVAGLVTFMILSAIIVKDALWGIRISDWINYFKLSVPVSQTVGSPINWYVNGIANMILLPFILYVVSGVVQYNSEIPKAQKLLWLYPLLLIIFLVFAFINNGYKTEVRFLLPAMPLICILGIQIFDYEFMETWKHRLVIFAATAAGVLIDLGLFALFSRIYHYDKWTWKDYTFSFGIPVAFSLFLAVFFLVRRFTSKSIIVPVVFLSMVFFPPALQNLQNIIIEKPNYIRVTRMYYPFSAFSKYIKYTPEMRMYISPTLPAHYQMLMRRIEEVRSMFDLYFNVYSRIDNFIFPTHFDTATQAYSFTEPVDSIKAMDYTQALIAYEDWTLLMKDQALFSHLTTIYDYKFDDQTEVVYLSLK